MQRIIGGNIKTVSLNPLWSYEQKNLGQPGYLFDILLVNSKTKFLLVLFWGGKMLIKQDCDLLKD